MPPDFIAVCAYNSPGRLTDDVHHQRAVVASARSIQPPLQSNLLRTVERVITIFVITFWYKSELRHELELHGAKAQIREDDFRVPGRGWSVRRILVVIRGEVFIAGDGEVEVDGTFCLLYRIHFGLGVVRIAGSKVNVSRTLIGIVWHCGV